MQGLLIVHGCSVLVAGIAAVTDHRTGHIPNWLTLPPIVVAPIVHGLASGQRGLLLSVSGIVACGLVPYLIFRLKGMAGGDVKLFAAMGAILGPFVGIEAEFYAMVFAMLFALAALAWHGKLLQTLANTFYLGLNPLLPKKWKRKVAPELMSTVRLGASILAGTVLATLMNMPALWGLT